MPEITIEELTQLAEDFLRENYSMALEIPIKRNNRLRTTMGRFSRYGDDSNMKIELAGFMFEYAAKEIVIDTLYHELVHYALYTLKEPHYDGHPHFEAELKRLGVSSTESNVVGAYVIYKCCKCGKETETRHRRLLREYKQRVTNCCKADIQIIGERIYDGTEAV